MRSPLHLAPAFAALIGKERCLTPPFWKLPGCTLDMSWLAEGIVGQMPAK